jgi:hypothetical protein
MTQLRILALQIPVNVHFLSAKRVCVATAPLSMKAADPTPELRIALMLCAHLDFYLIAMVS